MFFLPFAVLLAGCEKAEGDSEKDGSVDRVVKSVDITTLLPLLDSKSNCFLHTQIVDVGRKNTELKSLFINVETKNEEKVWNDMYSNCFQSKPVSENCNSRLKLVVFQKASLMLDEIVI